MKEKRKIIERFEYYDDDNYFHYWRTEKSYMMEWGICSQNAMFPKRRISEKEYEEGKEKALKNNKPHKPTSEELEDFFCDK